MLTGYQLNQCLQRYQALCLLAKYFQDLVHKIKKVSLHYLLQRDPWFPLVKPHLKFEKLFLGEVCQGTLDSLETSRNSSLSS